jgi:hypothetical protein
VGISWKIRVPPAQIATTSDLVLVRFTEPPPLPCFGVYREALDDVVRSSSAQRAALIHIAEVGPANRDRTRLEFELTRLMRDYDGKLVAAAMVIMVRGFLNAMVRSVAAGAIRVVRPKTLVSIVDEPREAAAHVARARGLPDATELEELVDRFLDDARGTTHPAPRRTLV